MPEGGTHVIHCLLLMFEITVEVCCGCISNMKENGQLDCADVPMASWVQISAWGLQLEACKDAMARDPSIDSSYLGSKMESLKCKIQAATAAFRISVWLAAKEKLDFDITVEEERFHYRYSCFFSSLSVTASESGILLPAYVCMSGTPVYANDVLKRYLTDVVQLQGLISLPTTTPSFSASINELLKSCGRRLEEATNNKLLPDWSAKRASLRQAVNRMTVLMRLYETGIERRVSREIVADGEILGLKI